MIKRKKKKCRICGKDKVLFSRGRCYECTPKKQINKVSKKTKNLISQYSKLRAIFLKENPTCKVMLPGCSGGDKRFLTIHHTKGREGDLLLNTELWITACIFCHDRIHTTDSAWAYENGFLIAKHYENIEKPRNPADDNT